MEDKISFEFFDFENCNQHIIDSIIELQSVIMQGLDKSSKIFMLEKQKEDYNNIIKQRNHILVCAFNNSGKLVGSLITKPSEHKTLNIGTSKEYDDKLECANCMVDPNYRTHGILKNLLKKVAEYYKHKKTLLTAEVVVNNYASLFSFLRSGFIIDNSEICKDDGAKLLHLFYVGEDKINTIMKENTDLKQKGQKLKKLKKGKKKEEQEIEKEFLEYKDILEKKQSIILDESECNEEYNVLLSCNLNELLKDFDNEFVKDIALQK